MPDRQAERPRKKLIEAGYFWAAGQTQDEEREDDGLAEDDALFDLPDDPADKAPEIFYVDYKNWPAWLVFLDCSTQWHRNPMTGKATGLDYTALKAVIDLHKPKKPLNMFRAVRLIESGVLAQIRGQEIEQIYGKAKF
tara:strand:+ start:2984 stop:3397 length:414 start_codon:yes stop_codon:yes gene_type:complete